MTDHKAEWVLVPRVATEAMVTAARGFSVPGYCVAAEQWPTIYAAMLAASPAPDEFQAAADDLIFYGIAVMRDGKRIDPRTVEIVPAASVAEDGELPGMWSRSDFTGGDPDERSHSQRDKDCPAASEGEDGAVATLLASDPYDETCSKGPWMDMSDWERLRAMPPGTKLYTRPAAQVAATPKHDEGREDRMLPDALVPHADEWYRLCERRFYARRIGISGSLAEAIVEAIATQPAAQNYKELSP